MTGVGRVAGAQGERGGPRAARAQAGGRGRVAGAGGTEEGHACARRGYRARGARGPPAPRAATAPARPSDQYRPRRDATLSLLTVLMLWQITLRPISRRCEILFVHRSAFPYLVLMALKTDSTVDRAW